MAYILATLTLWIIFRVLVPFYEWRIYYPTLIFTALLGTVSDLFGVVLNQWEYYGPVFGSLSLWSDLGIAPAEGGLFIKLFPRRARRFYLGVVYVFIWALGNAAAEWFFVRMNWIGYYYWNPFRAFIFYLFFFSMIWLQEYWYNGTGRLRDRAS